MGIAATSPTQRPAKMSLVSGEKSNFQFILRLLNTNVDGKQKIMYALTRVKGVGRRYSEELERIVTIIQNPTQYKIPTWFLNRQRDIVDGKDGHTLANGVDSKLRQDLERLKKRRMTKWEKGVCEDGIQHYETSSSG